jgi:hypothetical protein
MSDERIARALRLRMDAIEDEINDCAEGCEELYRLGHQLMVEALEKVEERAKLRRAWDTVCMRILAGAQPAEQCLDLDAVDNAGGLTLPGEREFVPPIRNQAQPGRVAP